MSWKKEDTLSWKTTSMEDDLRNEKKEYLSNTWSELIQIQNFG
jgi:hypothetical protein